MAAHYRPNAKRQDGDFKAPRARKPKRRFRKLRRAMYYRMQVAREWARGGGANAGMD